MTPTKAEEVAILFETLAIDHDPEGWPAVQQRHLSDAAAEIRRLSAVEAERDNLRHELAEVKRQAECAAGMAELVRQRRDELEAERDALRAERDALQVGIELMQDNAARYCWLRDNEYGDYGICVWDFEDGWTHDARSPAVVDATIDAAMKGTTP